MSALTPSRFKYRARCREVEKGAPSCGHKGPHHARCVLPPGHIGIDHEGNGYDEWGPKYECWTTRGG